MLECAKFRCDRIHVREDINERILIEFDIRSNLFGGTLNSNENNIWVFSN